MNERIRELARKANMVEVEYSPGFPDIRYPKNFEKFAELLIQECAKVSKQSVTCGFEVGVTNFYLPGYVEGKIKKHFGVEE